MEQEKYDEIKRIYNKAASWAVWSEVAANKKNDYDTEVIERSISALHARVVLVGLNVSADITERPDWSNFRGDRKCNRIRLAFQKIKPIHGAYMTDILKKMVDGNKVVDGNSKTIKGNIRLFEKTKDMRKGIDVATHIKFFEEEMNFIGADQETKYILFGDLVNELFEKHLARNPPFRNYCQIKHYACTRISIAGKKTRPFTDEDWVNDARTKLKIKKYIQDQPEL